MNAKSTTFQTADILATIANRPLNALGEMYSDGELSNEPEAFERVYAEVNSGMTTANLNMSPGDAFRFAREFQRCAQEQIHAVRLTEGETSLLKALVRKGGNKLDFEPVRLLELGFVEPYSSPGHFRTTLAGTLRAAADQKGLVALLFNKVTGIDANNASEESSETPEDASGESTS